MRLGRERHYESLLLATLGLVGSAAGVRAQVINSAWNGGTGNWSVATDWTPNGVPNNGGGSVYNVTIDSGGTDLVSLDLNATIASLAVGGLFGGTATLQNLSGTAETLEVTGATTINRTGTLTFGNASTLKLDGGLTVVGPITLNGATVATITGDVTSIGPFNVNGGSIATITGNVTNSAQFNTGSSGGGNTVSVGGTFTNNAGALLLVGGSGDMVSATTLTNSGTVSISSGAMLNLGTVNNNSGTFGPSSGGTVNVSGAFTNSAGANFNVAQSSVVNVGTLVNSGAVTVSAGGTLTLTNEPGGITDVPQGSSLIVSGTFNAGSGSALANLTSVEGTVNLENPQVTSLTPGGGTLTISSKGQLNLSEPSPTTLSISGSVNNSGVFTSSFPGAGTNTVNISGAFTNSGYLDLSGAGDVVNVPTLSNSGSINIGAGSTLNLTNQPNGITDIVKGSSISLTGSFTAGSGSALANLTSVEGGLDLQTGQTTSLTPSGGTLTISKSGQLEVSYGAASATVLSINGSLNNSGSVSACSSCDVFQGGDTLNVTGTFTNSSGATLTLYRGDVANIGTLVNSGTVTTGAGFAPHGTLNLTASGTDTNSGTINLSWGDLEISGSAVTLSGSGTVIMSSNSPGFGIFAVAPTDTLTSANTIEGSGTIGGMGFVNTGTVLANESSAASGALVIAPSSVGFYNQGTLNVSKGATLQITGLNSFVNYNSLTSTLTGGTYLVSGSLSFGAAGNTITTDAAQVTLTGPNGTITNFGGGNMIAPLATISAGGLFGVTGGANFTTQGNFTNNGTLTVGRSDKFVVKSGSSLTNFSGTTLTGGTYNVGGTLQFGAAGTSLVTNAARIALTGTNAKIIDSSGGNILTAFATNAAAGTFNLQSGATFTTSGNFSNAGTLSIGSGSSLTVGGPGAFTQTGGKTTDDGTLTDSGGLGLQGGSLFGKGSITGAVTSSGTITPGDSATATGILTDAGAYTQSSAGVLDITIAGATAGTQYDQLNPTTASLGGTLTINRRASFVPSIGSTFQVMNFTSESGQFSTVNGLAINSTEHFTITYQPTDVLLTVVSGPCCGPVSTPAQLNGVNTAAPSYSAGQLGRLGFGLHGRNLPRLGARPAVVTEAIRGRTFAGRVAPAVRPALVGWTGATDSGTFANLPDSPRLANPAPIGLETRTTPSYPSILGSIRPQTNPTAYVGLGVMSAAKLASVGSATGRYALNRMADFGPVRGLPVGGGRPYSFVTADASGAIRYRVHPAGAPFRNNAHTPRMPAPASLEYHLDLLSILATSPRRALSGLWRQPGSPDAPTLGYLTFGQTH
jgi:hypothetical protein